jgi:Domain of unknown function (DUF4340)
MKPRPLLIAALVLLTLSLFMFWSNRHMPTDLPTGASLKELPHILTLNRADITQLAIHRKDQPPLNLSRDGSGDWQITAPQQLAADQDTVSSLLTTVSSLTSNRVLEDQAADLASYGLANPSLELDITLKDNKTRKLLIGDPTPAGNSYFAVVDGDPRLFTVEGYNKTSLDKSAADLRDKRLLTADFDKVSQIDLRAQRPGSELDITFARVKDSWQILKPQPLRADSSHVDELIRSLQEAKLDTSVASDEKKDAATFGSAAPYATVKLTSPSGTQQLEIRRAASKTDAQNKDKKGKAAQTAPAEYYAKSSAVSGACKIPETLATSLDKSLDDFRDKKLFDFNYPDPDKIEIHDGAHSYFLTRSGSDWWGPDGKKIDPATVQPLVDTLRDLSATKFPDSGFSAPALEITVSSNGGKRAEKALISKNADRYIAKRDAEPSLYELSPSSITDLQKYAAALKPAPDQAAPAKK